MNIIFRSNALNSLGSILLRGVFTLSICGAGPAIAELPFSTGDTVSIKVEFDPYAPGELIAFGNMIYNTAVQQITLSAGTYDATTSSALMIVQDSTQLGVSDRIAIQAVTGIHETNGADVMCLPFDEVKLELADSTNNAVTSFDLPLTPPDLTQFALKRGFLHFTQPIDPSDPEPSPFGFVAFGITAINDVTRPRDVTLTFEFLALIDIIAGFTVPCNGALQDQISGLTDIVMEVNLDQGLSQSLDRKLQNTLAALDDINQNNDVAAVNSLQAFINSVEGQRGNSITDSQADELVNAAQAIIDQLNQQ